jgi:phosphoribosylformylglycinamidine cyclo-ligase
MVDGLLRGLAEACRAQKIVIPAGEIAEVPGAVNRGVWSATAIGIVEKTKVLRPQTIQPGDAVIALRSAVARSNGFSLIRKVLSDAFGAGWHQKDWKHGTTWGSVMLTPSIVYQAAILRLVGRYREKRAVEVKGVAHITGGGIPSKFRRVLKATGFGARLDNLWDPHEAIRDVIEVGRVPIEEAYRTWNMGNGMLIVVAEADVERAIPLLQQEKIQARRAGTITREPELVIRDFTGATRNL